MRPGLTRSGRIRASAPALGVAGLTMAGADEPAIPDPTAASGGDRARRRMVEHDVASRGVTDPRVLAAMAAVPRHRFVDPAQMPEAYADRPLPIGGGQTISQPLVVALMLEALELAPGDRLLEVGTGSGYAAAVASLLVARVDTIERIAPLAVQAAQRLAGLGFDRVAVHVGDGSEGWAPAAPYDAVLVSAAAPLLLPALGPQLAVGGRLVAPVGPPGEQRLVRVRRGPEGFAPVEDLGGVRFVPLLPGVEGA